MDLMSGNRLNNSYTYSENVLVLSGVTKNRLYRVSIEDSDFIPTNILSKSSTVLLLFLETIPWTKTFIVPHLSGCSYQCGPRHYDQPQDKYHIPPAEDNHGLKMSVFVWYKKPAIVRSYSDPSAHFACVMWLVSSVMDSLSVHCASPCCKYCAAHGCMWVLVLKGNIAFRNGANLV